MLNKFLQYVEIRTKITSFFAFAMTLAYLFYIGSPIEWRRTLVFFLGMFLFDLTTTAINNYIDSKTNDQELQFQRRDALIIIFLLFGASAALGLYLVYLTDLVVLFLGGICFLFGVFYTYGPVPISRQPLGELFSGFFYGLMIPFILLYINLPQGYFLSLHLSFQTIGVELQVMPILSLLLLSAAPVLTTANIMLANNICDVEKDIAVKRHTLPYYLGKSSLYLFAGLYYLIYLSVIALVALRILPLICLLLFATLVPVQKNIRTFFQKQIKSETFVLSIQNYIIIMGAQTLLIFLGRWIVF